LFAKAAEWKAAASPVGFSEALAIELATQATEFTRLTDLSDDLWQRCVRLGTECESQKKSLATLEEAREFYLGQISAMKNEVASLTGAQKDLKGWVAALEEAKAYYQGQLESQCKRIKELEAQREWPPRDSNEQQRWTKRVFHFPSKISRLIARRGVSRK
jgi:chromosome segregation ATPase